MAGVGVLVVEDDEGIGRPLVRALESEGYEVDWVTTGAQALRRTFTSPMVVLLDLGLPDVDGLDVCRRLRERLPPPQVLILTARRDEVDVVVGLDAGADDYLVKPFHLAELLARVRACARRATAEADVIVVGDLEIDVAAHRVAVGGREVELRPKEFDLVTLLAREAGRAVPRSQLMSEVWDEHWYGSTKTLDIHVWALRRKLDTPGAPSRISTLRGVGYRMEAR